MHHLWVLIPTYNEREALPLLVPRLMPVLRNLPDVGRLRVLVIDDDSPDGTGDVADELAVEHPELRVLHRSERTGLGGAYSAGFLHAVERGATKIVQMDVDGSHRPEHLPAMWEAGRTEAAVIGSRYCAGGRIEGWSAIRHRISRIVSWYGRSMLGLRVGDPNSGFRCWDADLLVHLLPHLRGVGFVFQAELTNCAALAEVESVEVPIVFVERVVGESKASWRIALEEAWLVASLRHHPPAVARYSPGSARSTAASHSPRSPTTDEHRSSSTRA